jgi:hypothetical protein
VDDELNEELLAFSATMSDSAPMVKRLLSDGYDRLHVKYILGHEFVAMFSDAMTEHKEFDEYFDIVGDAAHHYQADADETTPVTGSYFSLWSLCDVRFGADQETMAGCVVDVLTALQAEAPMVRLVEALSHSRMGVYQCQDSDGTHAQLRELVTGQALRCHCTSGYAGRPGELWFVRLAPPLGKGCDYHVTLTTPYVLTEATIDDWTAYLNKSLLGSGIGEPQNLHELLKFGKCRTAWFDFVVRAFQRADDYAVYLAGLPDVPSSLPSARIIEALQASDLRPGTRLAQERVLLELTPPQRKALVSLLPELADVPDATSHKPAHVRLLRLHMQQLASRVPAVISQFKGSQRKPYERLLESATADQSLVTGQAVFQLRIQLDGADPDIWRDIQACDCTLDDLHLLIQAAMGWENEHPYAFAAGGRRYLAMPDSAHWDADEQWDTTATYLSQVVPISDRPVSFEYVYDFGDEWHHTVTVQRIVPADKKMKYPLCLAGSGACPPEDCGGIYTYNQLAFALRHPDSDDYDEALEWLGESADHKAFDARAATRVMRRCAG